MFVAGLAVGAANAQFGDEGIRFFFDEFDVSDATARTALDPDLSFVNPTAANGLGADAGTPLYVYAAYGTNNQSMSSVGLTINITGPGVFRSGSVYNHLCNPVNRWQTIPTASPVNGSTSWAWGNVVKVGAGGYGARNNDSTGANGASSPGSTGPTQTADSHFRADDGSTFGTTLIAVAYIDNTSGVAETPGTASVSVKFANGASGNAGETVTAGDTVYFGFGDAGTQNKAGRTSASPDAYVYATPEPATLALIGLGVLALRRRR
jgi:hypothetical protein